MRYVVCGMERCELRITDERQGTYHEHNIRSFQKAKKATLGFGP